MKISQKAKNAFLLGTLCSVSYLAVYIARNVLGVVTTDMLLDGISSDYIGLITAVYLTAYAVGQLINGTIGDWIKAKYMICFGLLSAGISNFVFVQLAPFPNMAMIAYGWTGFSLSMIYGPMTKVVAESTELIYATRCSIGYTFASFLASPMAGILAIFLSWRATFGASSIALVTMAVVAFVFFTVFERRGVVKYPNSAKNGQRVKKDYRCLFKRSIVKYSLISMITGVIRTSFVAWLTTYFIKHLAYGDTEGKSIYVVASFVISLTTFVGIFLYERLGRDMHLAPLIFFFAATVGFLSVCFITNPMINVIVLVISVMSSNAAATILWSVYCPSLRDTGLVSGITGFLDFLSYSAAALGSLLIPHIIDALGWRNLIFIIVLLMIAGVCVCLPHFLVKNKNKRETNDNVQC